MLPVRKGSDLWDTPWSRRALVMIGSNRPRSWGNASAQPVGQTPVGRSTPFRAHTRRPVRIHSLVTHAEGGWQHQATVQNIGLGGARILVEETVTVGDTVTLSFAAPSLWDPLVLGARVAWVGAGGKPKAVGVAFEHKATDAVFALFELIVTLGYE